MCLFTKYYLDERFGLEASSFSTFKEDNFSCNIGEEIVESFNPLSFRPRKVNINMKVNI